MHYASNITSARRVSSRRGSESDKGTPSPQTEQAGLKIEQQIMPPQRLPPPFGSATSLQSQMQTPAHGLPASQGAMVSTPKASLTAHLAKAKDTRPPLFRLHPDIGTPQADGTAANGIFGSIRFADVAGEPAKFIRLPYTQGHPTSPADVLDLMSETWGLELPDALISIIDTKPASTGGPRPKELPKGVRLALQRGIAEAVRRTHAWLCTGGHTDAAGTRIAGLAVQYARRELNMASPTCVGIVDIDAVRQNEGLRETRLGEVFKYEASAGSKSSGGKVLEAYHTHFLLVDNFAASHFRARLERRISSFDLSGDGVRTPQVILVIGGDADTFETVARALDESDPATGTGVPVLVIKETAGAALDIYNYVYGTAKAPTSWPPPNQDDDPSTRRLLPDASSVDPAYISKAKQWLPKILKHGNRTGGNTTRQLAFYRIDDTAGDAMDLATTIQKAMLNDCPDARQEALLAVKWGEPSILKGKLEEMGFAATQRGQDDGEARSVLGYQESLEFDERLKVHQLLVVKMQKAFRGLLARRLVARKKAEQASLLLIALERGNLVVIKTLLDYSGAAPETFRADELFRANHNRYPIQYAMDGHDIDELWLPSIGGQAQPKDDDSDDSSSSDDEALPKEKNAFFQWLDTYDHGDAGELGGGAERERPIRKIIERGGTFHAERVLSAMADDYEQHLQARWTLASHDPRFILDDYRGFDGFAWLRREALSCRESEVLRSLPLSWTDLMLWAVLAGHHQVATLLWRKTKNPLRAALTASQMCRRLTQHAELAADHAHLLQHSLAYEDLAIDLLTCVREPDIAFMLLCQVTHS